MNTTRFIRNLDKIQKSFFESEFFRYVKNSSFSDESLAMLSADLIKAAMQGALNLEELEFKERELALAEEKTRQDLELSLLNAKAQGRLNQAETLKSLVQAQSMVRSVSDNAAINRANAYVGFLNVVGNASESSAIASHSANVISTINQIDISKLSEYNEPLKTLKDEILALLKIGDGGKEVFILAPKFEIFIDEYVKIMGFSIFENSKCRFILDEDTQNVIYSKSLLFKSNKLGKHKIRFESENLNGEIKADEIIVEVVEPTLKRLE